MLKQLFFYIYLCLAAAKLTGCAHSLSPSLSEPQAKLAEENSSVIHVAVYKDPIECTSPHALYPFFAKNKERFVSIRADKPVTLRVINYAVSGGPLFYNITFIPEAGQKYVVKNSDPSQSPFAYRVGIFKVVALNHGKLKFIPTRFIKRTEGLWAECNDPEMKENIKKISTSYPLNKA